MSLSFGLLAITLVVSGQPYGIRPKGLDEQLLNLDFQTADLRDWTVEGMALEGQPMECDMVARGVNSVQDPAIGNALEAEYRAFKLELLTP